MGVRGRTSAAELSVIGPSGIETVRRPDAPTELTDEQAVEWRAIVNSLPADWFPRETHAMLEALCKHVVSNRIVGQMIAALMDELSHEPEDCETHTTMMFKATKTLDRLLKMQEREGRAISSLATRLRISQQSTVRHEKARKPTAGKRPWDETA